MANKETAMENSGAAGAIAGYREFTDRRYMAAKKQCRSKAGKRRAETDMKEARAALNVNDIPMAQRHFRLALTSLGVRLGRSAGTSIRERELQLAQL